MRKSDSLHRHTGTFRYNNKVIPFVFWLHNHDSSPPDTVVFLGAGQVGKIGRWVAAAAPAGTIVIEGAPHWKAQPNAHDIETFMAAYTRHTFCEVLAKFRISSAHVVAESQATPGTVLLASTYPEKLHNIALIGPLGFSVQAYGDSPTQRLKTFKRRGVRSSLQVLKTLFLNPRSLQVGLIFVRAMLSEPSWRSLSQKWASGLSYDCTADCLQAAEEQRRKGASLTVLVGEKDRMFPVHEVRGTLEKAGIEYVTLEVVPKAFHTSSALRAGRKVLQRAIQIVRS